ncbi:RNA polymerase I-specific transcription initiation factor RRN6-like protein [Metarhizium rileyi]|uniref:RNA polymerase I-specific transcription initiation factor RRN6-like protein n=1 Tax=Metarhizium rileyi (strain RCEF 4871) TaxID=1649241 RepID=A0A166WPC9_METRR|nr:RNA polymerase I-specific transcription initiation factor RRN6-like protein [Metarhizium rileyi RCEF 4871]
MSMAPDFRIVGSLAELYPPSKQPVPAASSTLWEERQVQQRWLLKSHPEAFVGGATDLADYLKEDMGQLEVSEGGDNVGPLLAVGEMTDLRDASDIKGIPLLAAAAGVSGEKLRLTRMEESRWQWDDKKDAILSLSVVDSIHQEEETKWSGDGLPIMKIKFATAYRQNDSVRWLLVQTQTSITILRPEYHGTPLPDSSRPDFSTQLSSFITPNPLVTLQHHQTGGNIFSDVCFNPPSTETQPQLVVIDVCGSWSVWSVLGTWQVAKKTLRLSLHKFGHISEDVISTIPRAPSCSTQKHGIMQIGPTDRDDSPSIRKKRAADIKRNLGSSQSFLVWNSERISFLSLNPESVLSKLDILSQSRTEPACILDIQRSPTTDSHVFVLTNRQVIWLDLLPGCMEPEAAPKPKVILVCPHIGYWNEDCKMSLCQVSEKETDGIMVLILSPSADQLTVYWFSTPADPEVPRWHRHITSLSTGGKEFSLGNTQSIRVQPARLELSAAGGESGSLTEYVDADARFYQVTMLDEDLGVRYCICATSVDSSVELSLPTCRIGWSKSENRRRWKQKRKHFLRHIGETFVLPDSMTDNDLESLLREKKVKPNGDDGTSSEIPVSQPRPVLLKFGRIAQSIASRLQAAITQGECGLPKQLMGVVQRAVGRGVEEGHLPLVSWMDLISAFEGPVDHAEPGEGMEAGIEGLLDSTDDRVVVAQLRRRYLDESPGSLLGYPFLRKELSDLWLAPAVDSLPSEMQEIRKIWVSEIAREMFLSSYGVMVQNVPLLGPSSSEPVDNGQVDNLTPRSSSQLPYSSQGVASSSQASARADDVPDAAFQRLKLLAPTIKQGTLGSLKPSKVLSYWPTERGVDPEDYVSSIVVATEEKFSHAKRRLHRIEAKRKAQTEKYKRPAFMRQGFPASDGLGEDASTMDKRPPPVQAMSSQQRMPDSSQTFGLPGPSVTMSQPVAGAFGDRKKVKKEKRKSGFR